MTRQQPPCMCHCPQSLRTASGAICAASGDANRERLVAVGGQCFSRRILRSSRGDRDAKTVKWYDVFGKIITVPRGAYIHRRNKLEIFTELCYTVNVIKISAPYGRGWKGRKYGMNRRIITQSELAGFSEMLRQEERSGGTSEKYMRDVRALALWLDGREVSASAVSAWKEQLLHAGYAPATINSMLSAVNSFLRCQGWNDCRTRFLRIQRRIFRSAERELTRDDYGRLLRAASGAGLGRLELLLETICATGIRVSEVRAITVEAARRGRAEIYLKGKIRTILLPGKLCRKLLKYTKKEKIASGEIFLTRGGAGMSRQQIWREMKRLCAAAGVAKSKVFPHNLRHLFATVFYRASRDIALLADLLGHSSINTTRLYLTTTGADHCRAMERLGLIS